MNQNQSAIKVRPRHYTYDDESNFQSYDSGNFVLTAEWNALGLIIPTGERFFIRSVQELASRAIDPELKQKISAFIGQEAMHSKETKRSSEHLKNSGFPVDQFETWFDGLVRRFENSSPLNSLKLAATAGAEHYTAVLSLWHLKDRYCDKFSPSMRDLNQWHAAEELEHKAVAFDLLQTVSPRNYLLRAFGFIFGMLPLWLGYKKAMRLLLKHTGLTRAQIRAERQRARKIRIPLLSLGFPHLLAYLKPGFHPNDLDDGHLGEQILAEQAARGAPKPALG